MAAKAIAMEPLKQILRLKDEGFSIKAIVRHTGISRPTVKKYLARLKEAELLETTTDDVEDKELADAVFNEDTTAFKSERFTCLLESFAYAEGELSKTGVTRQVLWLEYREKHPDGYNYSRYCHYLAIYLKNKEVVMHLDHKSAETAMIDFAGKKLSYIEPDGGEVIECQVFVAVLPHSGLIFCKAVHSQNTYDFIDCINGMLRFYEGVPQTILCDNLKTAVTRPSRYEPVFTDMCYQLSEHYSTTFSAARPYKPRDKAMVERCVRIVYTHVYAPLRHQTFHSLRELNQAMAEQLQKLNDKLYKGSPYSRRQLFEQHEKEVLKSLPSDPFTLKKCIEATVQRNYHIQLGEDHHYYSVPYVHAGKKVKVWYDNKVVEVYYDHARIAMHLRSVTTRLYHTIPEHMPANHQHMTSVRGWTREDLLARASRVGKATAEAVDQILTSSIYQEQNYKSCHGLLMLQNHFGPQRLEAACARVVGASRATYGMIRNILKNNLDKQIAVFDPAPLPRHDNIRGAHNYQ
jgi:transposase